VDAYSIELLNTSEMGIANGFRQAAYRAAMLLSGSFFIALGGRLGWDFTYFVAAGVLAVCAVVSLRLPDIEIQRPKLSLFALLEPARELLLRHKLAQVTAFILLYKLGDFALGPMVRPFWLDKGLTTDQIGLITGTLGVIAAIAGGLTGGVFMARFGIFHGLWFLGLWQAVSNLSYLAVAYFPDSGPTAIYAASVAESFCGGLGTSAFLAYLMSICRKEYSATQYAVLSALFRVSGIIAGALSGAITGKIGYFQYFALSFFLSIPAFFFLIPAASWIPMEHKKPSSE
jgi:PAT family beta-lactamase induction signal transducer AmpG